MVGGWIASWASLLYYVLLYCCQSVGRSLRCCNNAVCSSCRVSTSSWVFFYSFVLSPAIPARAGMIQRTTINSLLRTTINSLLFIVLHQSCVVRSRGLTKRTTEKMEKLETQACVQITTYGDRSRMACPQATTATESRETVGNAIMLRARGVLRGYRPSSAGKKCRVAVFHVWWSGF